MCICVAAEYPPGGRMHPARDVYKHPERRRMYTRPPADKHSERRRGGGAGGAVGGDAGGAERLCTMLYRRQTQLD
jgi:hypothetical protein